MSNQDDNQWYFCTNENSEHLPPNLKYAQYIPPHIINSIRKDCYKYFNLFKQDSDLTDDSYNFENLNYYGPKEFLAEDYKSVNIEMFNLEWSRNNTLLIKNVHLNLNRNLWSPESFCNDFGELTVDLVNCKNHRLLPNQKMRNFWLGFENSELRMKDKNDNKMILKLKDWPPAEDFKTVLPTRYEDLMNNLPLGELTRRDGRFNLVSYLPNCFLKPDLGPKLYIAYSSAHTPKAGTTNLHVDISDAVNVLLYVGVDRVLSKTIHNNNESLPCSSSSSSSSTSSSVKVKDEIYETLKNTNCDSKQLNRYLNGEKVGAIWHIFLPEDADKIRSFLVVLGFENGVEPIADHDPIHDQIHYIDNKQLKRLKAECNVDPFVIIQYLGDAVFIPAGAPHQVRNIHSCIKVAEDFVTPQGIEQCFQLTDQFRRLPDTHSNHEDKLQIKNILYHTIKDCVRVIKRYNNDDNHENEIFF